MLARLMLLFIIVPMAELAILVAMTRYTSLLTTILMVLGTGALGAALARRQGFHVWQNVQQQLAQGKMPSRELMDGAMIVLAGAFLITPGLLTDTFGFCLLVPKFRRWCGTRLQNWALRQTKQGLRSSAWTFQVHSGGFSGFASSETMDQGRSESPTVRVIDPNLKRISETEDV